MKRSGTNFMQCKHAMAGYVNIHKQSRSDQNYPRHFTAL